MTVAAIRRHAPFWISLAAGIAIWEIAGRSTSAAFMVPFSETLVAFLNTPEPITVPMIKAVAIHGPRMRGS